MTRQARVAAVQGDGAKGHLDTGEAATGVLGDGTATDRPLVAILSSVFGFQRLKMRNPVCSIAARSS